MKLLQVRKGQFVYHKNELHKVYEVQRFFKQSVHLLRLHDMAQKLTTADQVDYYSPKHLDSFECRGKRYTLDRNTRAAVGDYILVINPKPDSLDHHHLHAIEMVTSVEQIGVVTNQSNGIKHEEYWLMAPGLADGATKIDRQDPSIAPEETAETDYESSYIPRIGDVYQKNDTQPPAKAMVIAIIGERVYFGAGLEADMSELNDEEKWRYVLHILEP